MKKSEIYKLAQLSVIDDIDLSAKTKLEIIHELLAQEKTERFLEEREEKEKANEAV